jgi:hypothetical protein
MDGQAEKQIERQTDGYKESLIERKRKTFTGRKQKHRLKV